MSTLVGDTIIRFRDLALDPPQVFSPPANLSSSVVSGGSIPSNTYYCQLTVTTKWGETTPSAEFMLTTTPGNQTFSIVYNWANYPGAPSGALGSALTLRLYFGYASGGENQYIDYPLVPPPGDPLIITSLSGSIQATPPATNSAALPDTDGSYLRASTVFRWLSSALSESSRLAGGLIDYSGFPSTINWATYTITGEWTKMLIAWYDGYPVAFSPTSAFFKRNNVTSSILAGWGISYYNGQMGVEVWPQPARTATQTTLSSSMAITDTSATLTTTAGFLLPTYGMVQIGGEICAYNGISGSQLVGLIRGLGGTVPAAWSSGTQVNELNAFFQGKRVFTTQYSPGQSLISLPLPSAWPNILVDFMMAKFYETERDGQSAKANMDSFNQRIKDYMRTNRQILGPQQVGSRDYQFVVFGGTRFGGNVIP